MVMQCTKTIYFHELCLHTNPVIFLTLCPLEMTADNLCKQFGPRPGLTKCWVLSGSKLFATLMVFLKVFFFKYDIEKYQQATKNMQITQ